MLAETWEINEFLNCWRITNGLFNFFFVTWETKRIVLEEILVVSGFPSNIHHFNFRHLDWPTSECLRINASLLNLCFKLSYFWIFSRNQIKISVVPASNPSTICHSKKAVADHKLLACQSWPKVERLLNFPFVYGAPSKTTKTTQSNKGPLLPCWTLRAVPTIASLVS